MEGGTRSREEERRKGGEEEGRRGGEEEGMNNKHTLHQRDHQDMGTQPLFVTSA